MQAQNAPNRGSWARVVYQSPNSSARAGIKCLRPLIHLDPGSQGACGRDSGAAGCVCRCAGCESCLRRQSEEGGVIADVSGLMGTERDLGPSHPANPIAIGSLLLPFVQHRLRKRVNFNQVASSTSKDGSSGPKCEAIRSTQFSSCHPSAREREPSQ